MGSRFLLATEFLLPDRVGVNIKGYASRLERDYGISATNILDLRTHAKARRVEVMSRSLAGMTATLLGKQLPKDPAVRFSR